jgi:hypothetical protein
MEALEMAAVVCQQGSAEGMGAGQQVRVGDAAPAVLLSGQHIMPEPA